jgi:hypothetical protein
MGEHPSLGRMARKVTRSRDRAVICASRVGRRMVAQRCCLYPGSPGACGALPRSRSGRGAGRSSLAIMGGPPRLVSSACRGTHVLIGSVTTAVPVFYSGRRPDRCQRGHMWRGGTILVGWLPCSCDGARAVGWLGHHWVRCLADAGRSGMTRRTASMRTVTRRRRGPGSSYVVPPGDLAAGGTWSRTDQRTTRCPRQVLHRSPRSP